MVWYEEKIVNGISVLVPTVYLADADKANLTAAGAMISGDVVRVNAANVNNSGAYSAQTNLQISANNITAAGGSFKANNDVTLSASQNLTISQVNVKLGGENLVTSGSGVEAGGNAHLAANQAVTLSGATVKAGKDAQISGQSVTLDMAKASNRGAETVIGSSVQSGGSTSVKAKDDVLIIGSAVAAKGNLDVSSDNGSVNVLAGNIVNKDTKLEANSAVQSSLTSGGDASIKAEKDILVFGSKVNADGKTSLSAQDKVTISEAYDTSSGQTNIYKKKTFGSRTINSSTSMQTAVGSSISGGAGVDITSGNDTIISASKVQAGTDTNKADLNINSGGDLIIASGKNIIDRSSSESKSGFLSKSSGKSHNFNETTIGTALGASGNVNLNAERHVGIAGATITAGENIAIEGDSVSIIGAQEQHDTSYSSKKSGFGVGSGGGFYSIYGKEEKSSSEDIVANVGSKLSAGNDVSIKARETDINIVGSKVEAENDITLNAARDVNILPGAESYASEEKEKRSGFGIQLKSGNGSASIGIGYGSSKDETRQGAETNAVSALSAGNNVTINAGRDANLQAARVEADNDVTITAERDVNLLAAQDKTNYETMHKELFAGITAAVSTGLISSANSIADAAKKAANVSDGYSSANAGFAGLKAYDAIKNLQGMANGTGNIASASIGVGFEYSKSKENAESSVPVVTDIRGGNSVSIEAKSGDINSHGAQIIAGYDEHGLISGGAGDISLKAGNDINLESAQATNSASSSNMSASASIGYSVGVGLGKSTGGWTGSANVSSGKSNSNGTTQVNSHVTGAGDIKLEAGRDTNLKGAVVEGETITAKVGRDLNIISVPDTGESSNKSSSIGVSGSLGAGGATITGVSPGYGTGSGETNWIGEQSGLVAKDKVDVTVGGNTHLGAGKIISESGDLKLDTGTLTHEDFSGSKKYEGFDIQANIDLTGKKQQPDQTSQPNHTAEGSYKKDDTRQEVRATVGPGEIIVRDKDKQAELEASGQTEDLASLNRDPNQAYEITKDKHVEIDFYLSDTSLNAVASGIGKAMEPGGFVDRYLIGRELTPEERSNVREGLNALANGGSLGGCGPQRQGFNRFNPLGWVVSSAYAYETDCFIIKADGSKIELGISTYEQCRDAIKAYLNSLSFDDRTRVIRDAGFVTTSGALPGDLLTWHVNDLVRMVVEDLDGGKRGTYSEFYNQGVFAGEKSGIAKSAELASIWGDPALSVSEKINKLRDAGVDIMGIMAATTMGGIGNSGKAVANLSINIHAGQQGKHILGHNNFIPGRSYFYKDINPQALLDGIHAGRYPVVGYGARGQPIVNFGREIGVDAATGLATRIGTIHSGKNGAHIVPANPNINGK